LIFALQYFVRLQKTLTAFKAICYIKSLIKQLRYQIPNEKIWSQMKSGKETGQESRASSEKEGTKRQRLLEETAEEKEACLGKRKEA
jgi:hypothetical protein